MSKYPASRLFFASILIITSWILIVPLTSAATASCPVAMSKPYRSPTDSVVYLVTTECTKRPFFNPDVYFSFFTDWNQVTFVEQNVLGGVPDDALHFVPWGPLRTFKNGSLVKLTSNPVVYLLEDGKAYPLTDENTFKAFGYSFDQVEDVTTATLDKFSIQTNAIKNANDAPPSLVFKYPDGPNVYVLKQTDSGLVKARLSTMEEVNAISRGDRIATLPINTTFTDTTQDTPISDTVPPTILSFQFPSASSTSFKASIRSFTATDNVGVTGYLLTETSSTPSVTNPKWVPSSPTNYSFSSTGTNVLYAWAKDASGNISTSQIASVTIVDSSTDITPPVISSFLLTPAPGGFTVTWKTNEASNSVISYGTTDSYGSVSSSDALVISHSISVIGLNSSSLYHFRISSTDAGSNTQSIEDKTVSTTLDTTPPTITDFSMPASSTSMTVPITAFTATDDVGVTGYLLTKTSSIPFLVDAASWSSTAPTSYSFAQSGEVTLYAWTKDALGHISNSRIASSIISFVPYATISSVTATPFAGGLTVTWLTNQPTTSVVSYGLTDSYGDQATDSSFVLVHTARLSGLISGRTYHYIIRATNAQAAEQNTGDLSVRVQ